MGCQTGMCRLGSVIGSVELNADNKVLGRPGPNSIDDGPNKVKRLVAGV